MKRLVLILCLLASPLWAVTADEMLDDPVLEARAQALESHLRCVVCQSESLASSNSKWAGEARVLLRDLLTDGMSDQEILDFFVVRYGEFVLMEPQKGGANTILWYAGPGMLIIGLGIGLVYLRRRSMAEDTAAADALTDEEKSRLAEIMDN